MRNHKNISIALVELLPELPNLSSFHIFPFYGTFILATKFHNWGFDVTTFVEGVSKFNVNDLEKFHFVCFSTKSSAANKIYKISDHLRSKGKTVIMGGTHATYFPEDCLLHSDYVVHGEGDDALPRLIDCLIKAQDPAIIPGLSYIQQGEIIYTGDQIPPEDITTIADYSLIKDISDLGRFSRLVRRKRVLMPVQSSRGCPNKCSFCIVRKMFGTHYRKRPVHSVISEIRAALQYSRRIVFIDNNFVGSSEAEISQTKTLLRAIKENFHNINASVFVTSDIAKRPKLLTLMYSAGIRQLVIGFESLNAECLDSYHKSQPIPSIKHSLELLKMYGFTISGTFIANGDYDTPRSIIDTARTVAKLNIDFMYYFIWSPYPHILNDPSVKKRIFINNWDYLNGYHQYLFSKKTLPSKLQKAVLKANRVFYSYKRIFKRLANCNFELAKELLLRRMLFRKVERAVYKRKYILYLNKIESRLYPNGTLDETMLATTKIECLKVFDSNYIDKDVDSISMQKQFAHDEELLIGRTNEISNIKKRGKGQHENGGYHQDSAVLTMAKK